MEKNYEAMIIIKPDLPDTQKSSVFDQITQTITKNNGKIVSAEVWQEKRRFTFRIKKFDEGLYYLVKFNIEPDGVSKLRDAYKLNENILRSVILVTK